MKRILCRLGKLRLKEKAYAVMLFLAATTALPAQTLTTLHSFDGADGMHPRSVLIQASNGDFYGTTYQGGVHRRGTVFKWGPSGLTHLYSFCSRRTSTACEDGAYPLAGLVQASNGDFYGTTERGGANQKGTIFKITSDGTLTTLYNFCSRGGCTDGDDPKAGLIQARNGDLYGTTNIGGARNRGTVFRISLRGTLTTLYSFCSQSGCTDGAGPLEGLVQAANGDLYGTAMVGGTADAGTIFKITPDGTLTTLHSFSCSQSGCAEGQNPNAVLVQASNGDFYGTTQNGGANGVGGTVFKITPSGTLTTLYSFCQCTNGDFPAKGLTQASDGDLYGTTAGNYGTVFKITPSGTLTTLYSFCSQSGCTDGDGPNGLVHAANGNFYGTTVLGGAYGFGTIFSLSVGLGPFAETSIPALFPTRAH